LTNTDGNDTKSRSYNPCREVKPASSVETEYQYDYQSSFQSSKNHHRRAGRAELLTRNWESSSASSLGSTLSLTSNWVAYKLDIPMQSPMAMMSSERKPLLRQPCQVKAHTIIGDITEITVSNSDNDLHLIPRYEWEIG
jgi:hypothetical protein